MNPLTKPTLLNVCEAAFRNPYAVSLLEEDKPRANGVAITYQNLEPQLAANYVVHSLTPFDYPGRPRLINIFNRNAPFPLPFQNLVAVRPSDNDINTRMRDIRPDHVHIATEGWLGQAAMRGSKKNGIPVSVCHHTKWQEYVEDPKYHVPAFARPWAKQKIIDFLTEFYAQADAIMVASDKMKDQLAGWGLDRNRMYQVGRAADPLIFHPRGEAERLLAEPYTVHVGRIAPGKLVEEYCELQTGDWKKVVVGTGDLKAKLERQYPDVLFAGFKQGDELGRWYACAELFASASTTETLGIVFKEANASGTPVIGKDKGDHTALFTQPGLAVLRGTLQQAFDEARANPGQFMPRHAMAAYIQRTGWKDEAEKFHRMVQACAARPHL